MGADDNVSAIVTRAVAIAHYGQVAAVEIINEANNVSIFQGQLGEQKLVSLTNMVEAEVRKVSSMAVIGLGRNRVQKILYMLSLNPVISGLVCIIPYYHSATKPATVYESPYYDYVGWVNVVRSNTELPIWETEWGFSG